MKFNLQTLNALIGSTVRLMNDINNEESYSAQFIGYSNDQSLMFAAPKIGVVPLVPRTGETMVVKFNDGEKQLAFRSEVIAVCETPYLYFHLSFPKGVEGALVRRGLRYPVDQKNPESLTLTMSDGDSQTQVQLTDISLQGACMSASNKLGNIDDSFAIDFMVDTKRITLPCKIRYVRNDSDKTTYIHGVEFQPMELDAQLFIDHYIQKHIRQQRSLH